MCFLLSLLTAFQSPAQDTISIIPQPVNMKLTGGYFPLHKSSIKYTANGEMKKAALFFAEALKKDYGIILPINLQDGNHAFIDFVADKSISNPEAYKIEIRQDGITIRANHEKGFFWAVQTLRQLLPLQKSKKISLPCLQIEDEPAFALRSNMLDVGRHFFPVNYIRQHIDMLSYYKINTFHWHLTDDQGWRIEIKKYPKLTSVGGWRKEADGTTHGGFYTQEEIKSIVQYAQERNITIIPEIEMPGHCRAALAAYPRLSCEKKRLPVPSWFGVLKDVYCVGQEETYGFVQDVLDEVLQLFPSKYVHIGGDECPKDRWKACPVCQQRMKQEGLKDEHELQSYFVKRIQKYLDSKGRQLVGWDEIMEGGADKNALIEIWRGEDKAKEAISNGNKIIQTLYFDAAPGSLTLEKTFGYNASVNGDVSNVLGADCPLWTEWVTTHNVEYMMYPRLQAFAESLWNGKTGYDDFHARLQKHYQWMDAKGILYGAEDKNLISTQLKYLPLEKKWRLYGEAGIKDMQLFYSIDKNLSSKKAFKDSVTIASPGKINVVAMRKGKQASQTIPYNISSHLGLGKTVTFNEPYSDRYAKAGPLGLTDGITGSWSFNDGNWMAWSGTDLDAVVDLGSATAVKYLQLNCMQQTQSWILFPKQVEYYISADGQQWQLLKAIAHNVPADDFTPQVHAFVYKADAPVKTRYIRVKAINYGTLPAWHIGAGGKAWIFADEIIVR
jgi:hexosaminidase